MAADAPNIVWFRDDLRLADNAALSAAAAAAHPLICLFILDEESGDVRPRGAASRWWLAQSLRALDAGLQRLGQRLVLRRGRAEDALLRLAAESGAAQVFCNRRYQAPEIAADAAVRKALQDRGVAVLDFPGNVLIEPGAMPAYKVFTPFWKRVRAADIRRPILAPARLPPPPDVPSASMEEWKLEPSKPDWAGGLRESWEPGEAAARTRLADFLDTIAGYHDARDRPDQPATSRLSPYLHFGEISAAHAFHAARFAADEGRAPARDTEKFLSEIGWREFSQHLLHANAGLATVNLQRKFDRFPWRDDKAGLKAWQRGHSGYPIVDAGMRQLWRTGWMHNRVRMIVASFLIKHLLIDWRCGERWFWDTLVDADAANNAASWQWVAGSGADAAPYFRIFNPVLQGEKFDPDGTYVRAWVPELARLAVKFIHRPWAAPPLLLEDAEIRLDRDYPAPIVDHDAARKRALAAFASIKGET